VFILRGSVFELVEGSYRERGFSICVEYAVVGEDDGDLNDEA
jgi:hypothetical protein